MLADRGALAAARKSYEESLALRERAGEKQAAAETQVALASLAIEEGHAHEAEDALKKCMEQFHREQAVDDELAASTMLTRALLAEGKIGDAKKEIEGAKALATQSQNQLVRFQFDLARARVLLTSERPNLPRAEVDEILGEARKRGFVGIEFEARLVLAEWEKKSGHDAVARTELAGLENSARSRGYGLVARKAAAAR